MLAISMEVLARAHRDVGGDVVSAGGTGTYDLNTWATEIQAGSYALMDTAYAKLGLPFTQALTVLSTVSVRCPGGMGGGRLRSQGARHGPRQSEHRRGHRVVLLRRAPDVDAPDHRCDVVGDRIHVVPAHIDPTVAYHRQMHVVDGEDVLEAWEVDLRGW